MTTESLSIAHLVLSLDVGGLERLTIDLAGQQRAAGHDARIFCVWRKGALANQARNRGIPVEAFGKGQGFSPTLIWRLADQLRRFRADVLHTHNAMVHHYGVSAAILVRVPAIVNTLHGQHGTRLGGSDERLQRLYRFALPWTGVIAMVSEATKSHYLTEWGIPERKCRVVLNGIATDRFRTSRESRPALRFGAVGRFAPVKDHVTLIDAFARVVAAFPEAELHIAGDGEERLRIEQRIAMNGLGRSVRLHGALDDIPEFLGSLDAFVLPSLSEGLPLALLEAMATGLPVVSTRLGGLTSVAPEDEVAFYCAPGDPEALAAQMIRMAHADMASMGAAGQSIVRRRFSVAQTALQYEEVYRELLGRRSVEIANARSVLHG